MKRKPESDKVLHAALYIRVSSEEQAMHGLSLQAQQDSLEEYAQTHGYKVVSLYADEGITARKKYRNRGEFMRMIGDVKQGKIDVILFIKLDRWFRNVADYYEVQKILDDHNVSWVATEERYDTTTANGRLNLNIRLSIAQDESDRTGERIKFIFANKVQRGEVISGKVPLGYRIEDKKLAIDEVAAEQVRDIFNQYLQLQSIRQIRQYAIDKYNLVYSHTGMRVLLQNEKYIGLGHGREDWCPPILDRQLFETVSRLATQRSARVVHIDESTNVYLFRSLAFCAECGRRLAGHLVGGKYIYYRCSHFEKMHLCSHKKRTNEQTIEKWLLDNLIARAQDYNASITQSVQVPRPTIDVDAINKKLVRLKDLYLSDLIEREHYEQEYHHLRALLRENQYPQPQVEQHEINIPNLQGAIESYEHLDRKHKKAFWAQTIKSITITDHDDFSVELI